MADCVVVTAAVLRYVTLRYVTLRYVTGAVPCPTGFDAALGGEAPQTGLQGAGRGGPPLRHRHGAGPVIWSPASPLWAGRVIWSPLWH